MVRDGMQLYKCQDKIEILYSNKSFKIYIFNLFNPRLFNPRSNKRTLLPTVLSEIANLIGNIWMFLFLTPGRLIGGKLIDQCIYGTVYSQMVQFLHRRWALGPVVRSNLRLYGATFWQS